LRSRELPLQTDSSLHSLQRCIYLGLMLWLGYFQQDNSVGVFTALSIVARFHQYRQNVSRRLQR
jgi:hypothetical protein